jgi:demethylmenaquinone methyltransferase / 2-methoxy-6-polyprenyl-1,4-benzoquinol methylase
MRDEQTQIRQVHSIFNRVVPVYDMLNHVLSGGQDIRWRNFAANCLRPGPTGRVLDVATGTGDLALKIACLPHRPLVIGLDLVPAMLEPALKKAEQRGCQMRLLAGDGTKLPFADASFDAVTIAFGIRNIPRRHQALQEMLRVLVPGGRIYVLEFTTPQNPLVRRCYQRYLVRALPRIAGWISGDVDSYRYLAETILEFPTPEAFRQEMTDSGLAAARSYPMTRGVAWLHVAEKPCPPGMDCRDFLNQMAPAGVCAINPGT